MSRARWLLPALCLALAAAARAGDEDVADDERLLRACDYPAGGAGLPDVFRNRTPSPAVVARARALLRQCGSEEFAAREKGSAGLVALGPQARPLLREALADPDPEVARRAEGALEALTRPDDPACLEAAARLLGRRRPEGAVAVLLAYLPYAEEATLADEIAAALSRAGVRDGRPDPALVRALADRHPLVRAVAADALTRGGVGGQRDAVRELLADPDPAVRERVALALLDAQDKEAVPALVRAPAAIRSTAPCTPWPATRRRRRCPAMTRTPAASAGPAGRSGGGPTGPMSNCRNSSPAADSSATPS